MAGRMNRRALIRYGALGGAAAVAAGPLAAAGAPAPAPAAPPPFELDEATVADLQKRMGSGADTARSIAGKYLARIEALEPQGAGAAGGARDQPGRARDRRRARRRAQGRQGPRAPPRHPGAHQGQHRHGRPDERRRRARWRSWARSPPPTPFVAKRLREAGAVILGKTNLSEWANFRSTHSSSGWSGRGGQCRNPYALDRSPSGSSSGLGRPRSRRASARSAVGTETDGSIVSPSNNCGLVGVKPTVGLVEPRRHHPDRPQPGHGGPDDAHRDRRRDPAGGAGGRRPGRPGDEGDRGQACPRTTRGSSTRRASKGARIGVPRKKLFGQSTAADRLVDAAIADMKRLGAVIVDPADIADARRVRTTASSRSCSTSSRPT